RVGFGIAVLVAADGGRLVALRQSGEDGLPGGGRQLQAGLLGGSVEQALELVSILDERTGERAHKFSESLLQRAPFGLLLRTRSALLLRLREPLEALLLLEADDALRAGLEVEPERSLDGDLSEAEVSGRKDAADDDVLFLPLLRHLPCLAVLEVGKDPQDILRPLEGDLAPLITEILLLQNAE